MLYWLPGIGTVGPKADPGTGTYLRYGGAVHGTVLWYMVRYVVRLWYVFTVHTVLGAVRYGTVRLWYTWYGTWYGCGKYVLHGGVVRARYCGTVHGTKTPNGRYSHFRHLTSL